MEIGKNTKDVRALPNFKFRFSSFGIGNKLTETKPNKDSGLRIARRRAALSVGLNLLLSVAKGLAGVFANSTALISDAIHSATDVLASGAAYVGLWVAGKRHPSFPYGLYKAETVATLVISMAVLLAAYEIGRNAIFGPVRIPDVSLAFPVAAGSLAASWLFGFFQLRAGRRLNSPALIADARDYLADSLSTGVVLIGLIGAHYGYALDRWAAAVVSVFVFRSGGQLLIMALRDLLDASIDRETERAIIKLVESHPLISEVDRCLSRTAGGRFIVDLDVVLRTKSHEIADRVADRLEEDILSQFPRVVMSRIRPHFGYSPVLHSVMPVTGPEGKMAENIARAPWFLIEARERETGKVLKREFVENPYRREERKRGYLVGKWLLSLKPDQITVASEREGTAIALLREAGVEIIVSHGDEAADTNTS